MPHWTSRGRGRALTAVLALAAVTSAAGCSGGGGGWKAPAKGQAAVLLGTSAQDGTSGAASLGFAGSIDGLAFGPGGEVYGLDADLVRIDADRRAHIVLDDQAKGAHGLVARPDGSFLTGRGATVSLLRADGTDTVLAGGAGPGRVPDAPVPATAGATAFRFGNTGATPFGVRQDGSVLLADGDVVWSLKDSTLTRVYQAPGTAAKGRHPAVMPGSAVDGTGTAWVAAGSLDDEEKVGDIVTIAPGGKAAEPALPAKATGATEDLASLRLLWLAADGANGVYAHATSAANDYVLHLRPGSAQVVARHRVSAKDPRTCDLPHPVDATRLPCKLPYALAYHDDRLVLAGQATFVLTIAVA
ncbi:hypothetical protein [Streptomyces sp. NPDC049040]|uniref:hypothetical protein n=1 Tax=Streptomyces sp. NPDC049040 TaxID=3365593 RepID=UPI00371826E5